MTDVRIINEDGVLKGVDSDGNQVPIEFDEGAFSSLTTGRAEIAGREMVAEEDTIVVDEDGDDDAPGTESDPIATIQEAFDRVAWMSDDIEVTIDINPGTYTGGLLHGHIGAGVVIGSETGTASDVTLNEGLGFLAYNGGFYPRVQNLTFDGVLEVPGVGPARSALTFVGCSTFIAANLVFEDPGSVPGDPPAGIEIYSSTGSVRGEIDGGAGRDSIISSKRGSMAVIEANSITGDGVVRTVEGFMVADSSVLGEDVSLSSASKGLLFDREHRRMLNLRMLDELRVRNSTDEAESYRREVLDFDIDDDDGTPLDMSLSTGDSNTRQGAYQLLITSRFDAEADVMVRFADSSDADYEYLLESGSSVTTGQSEILLWDKGQDGGDVRCHVAQGQGTNRPTISVDSAAVNPDDDVLVRGWLAASENPLHPIDIFTGGGENMRAKAYLMRDGPAPSQI